MDAFDKDNLSPELLEQMENYRCPDGCIVRLLRIDGPFQAGPMLCADGWLALDDNSNPYPIDADIVAAQFVRV